MQFREEPLNKNAFIFFLYQTRARFLTGTAHYRLIRNTQETKNTRETSSNNKKQKNTALLPQETARY